jgi:chromate transporter
VWVTRARPKIDRIACPWLIRRFVDPHALFLFVAPLDVVAVAERFGGVPFDIENVFWSHRGDTCTFDTMVEEFGLGTEPLFRLATIVRGADIVRPDLSPEAPGLLAASLGLSRMYADDLQQLEAGMLLYDAFYRWCRDATDETHNGPPTSPRREMNEAPIPLRNAAGETRAYPSLSEAARTWVRVALLSFGGPAGQIAVMHRILVEEKRWISEQRFLHALNYCMLLPGPEAQQLATYIGWLMHRTLGGIIAGGLFIVPGIASIMALSFVYALWGDVPVLTALFFGLKAAVLVVVVEAVLRIGKRALKTRLLMSIAAISFIAIFFLGVPFPLIVLAAAAAGFVGSIAAPRALAVASGDKEGQSDASGADSLLGDEVLEHTRPRLRNLLGVSAVWLTLWLLPVAVLLATFGTQNVFSQIALFFSKMAMVTFGGAYAVLAYVAQQAVAHYGWLKPGEMLDGLGMAETTPGPLIMVLQFVGFMAALRDSGPLSPLLAGTLGGLLATWVTFTPCFLWIFLGAPFAERLRSVKALNAALSAITAAVVGVVLNLAGWFAVHTLFHETIPVRTALFAFDVPQPESVDLWALAIAGFAAMAIFRFGVGMIPTLLASCLAGIALYVVGAIG